MDKPKNNLIWVDNIKLFACIFVAVGHFFQSMISSNLIVESRLYAWFIQTIYFFHVQLFFICSGYLYQRRSTVFSIYDWKRNILKKFVSLGLPYFVFSGITWLLKNVFSGSVNSEVDGFLYCLFVHPLSPYWYLFALFFMFVITPTFRRGNVLVVWILFSFVLKFMIKTEFYAINIVIDNLVWFLMGMSICKIDWSSMVAKWSKLCATVCLVAFLFISITLFDSLRSEIAVFAMGVLACSGVLILAIQMKLDVGGFSQYTMPIYLMHTIFAAGIRSVLLKLGVTAALIHVPVGIVATFVGPIIAYEIMKRTKLDFFIEPRKYVRIG